VPANHENEREFPELVLERLDSQPSDRTVWYCRITGPLFVLDSRANCIAPQFSRRAGDQSISPAFCRVTWLLGCRTTTNQRLLSTC
jgi:hypothetical protein